MPDKVLVEFDVFSLREYFCRDCPCECCSQEIEDVVKCCIIAKPDYYEIKNKEK